jgi:hypothetical protein
VMHSWVGLLTYALAIVYKADGAVVQLVVALDALTHSLTVP